MNRFRWKFSLLVLLAAAAVAPSARADRPYVATTSAAAEEDDYRAWSISSWVQRDKLIRELGVNVEYAFEPRLSIEFTATHARPRAAGEPKKFESEVEVKWLYNSIARDGWGLGASFGVGSSREEAERWRSGHWQIVVPFSLQLAEHGLLHLNVGVARERGESSESLASLAAEWSLAARWTAFGEWARRGEQKLLHAGLRWWLKRERYALDFSLLRPRYAGDRATRGWSVNVSIYDL